MRFLPSEPVCVSVVTCPDAEAYTAVFCVWVPRVETIVAGREPL